MPRTVNHYDALGYAEGWNLVARPTTDQNLFELRGALVNELKHRVMSPESRRTLRAKLVGLDSALTALRNEPWDTTIVLGDEEV